jgi:hypothetical protein
MNRFNAPEVLAALFKALEVAGLDDTISHLKKLGVPSIIDRAWRERPKMASSENTVSRVASRFLSASRYSGKVGWAIVLDGSPKKAVVIVYSSKSDAMDEVGELHLDNPRTLYSIYEVGPHALNKVVDDHGTSILALNTDDDIYTGNRPPWATDPAAEAKKPRDITVRYKTIDRFSETRKFKTLALAQRYAWKRVGETPEISKNFGYAVSGDGVGKVTIQGATLREIFPRAY